MLVPRTIDQGIGELVAVLEKNKREIPIKKRYMVERMAEVGLEMLCRGYAVRIPKIPIEKFKKISVDIIDVETLAKEAKSAGIPDEIFAGICIMTGIEQVS